MKFYDVFNGDADGLCALHQLRLALRRLRFRRHPLGLGKWHQHPLRQLEKLMDLRNALLAPSSLWSASASK